MGDPHFNSPTELKQFQYLTHLRTFQAPVSSRNDTGGGSSGQLTCGRHPKAQADRMAYRVEDEAYKHESDTLEKLRRAKPWQAE